jgi:transcription initiation factor TFIID subunit 11
MANFSDEQLNRYEIYRRAAFPKANVKRVMTICIFLTLNNNFYNFKNKIIQTICGKSCGKIIFIYYKNDCLRDF